MLKGEILFVEKVPLSEPTKQMKKKKITSWLIQWIIGFIETFYRLSSDKKYRTDWIYSKDL